MSYRNLDSGFYDFAFKNTVMCTTLNLDIVTIQCLHVVTTTRFILVHVYERRNYYSQFGFVFRTRLRNRKAIRR